MHMTQHNISTTSVNDFVFKVDASLHAIAMNLPGWVRNKDTYSQRLSKSTCLHCL